MLETTICLSNIATLKNGYAFQSGKYNALGKWKILTITNVSGERYINDEDYNCIINLPNDIQDHQVLKEGDILISLTGNVGRVSLCKDGDYLLNQRVGLLQLAKNVNQEFLYQILSSQRFENSMIACGQGAAQMNIGKGDVESYVLPYSSNVNNILLVAKILHSYDEYIIYMGGGWHCRLSSFSARLPCICSQSDQENCREALLQIQLPTYAFLQK